LTALTIAPFIVPGSLYSADPISNIRISAQKDEVAFVPRVIVKVVALGAMVNLKPSV
jgi:hypothetical protein